jgi:membrane-bound inhibitor of C-type lysozyme
MSLRFQTAASILALALLVGAAAAKPKPPAGMQPPMNQFDFAFYLCDGESFQVSYDSETPKVATLTLHNKQYELDRQPSADGVEFSKGNAKFWTDGSKTVVQGAGKLENCKRKGN